MRDWGLGLYSPSWSPDGTRIVAEDEANAIEVVGSGNHRRLLGGDAYGGTPAWQRLPGRPRR